MPPAARIGDLHTCKMETPIPHVGGPISTGCMTVWIGGQPAARVGDLADCDCPPNAIAMGSPTVWIGDQMAARQGDPMVHPTGVIDTGCPTVWIGIPGQGKCLVDASESGSAFCEQADDSEEDSGF
jgi:uncharacterized Zn-binding protein involved in type VI secretion